jgi:transcriptional regulator with XRE-family HTH domain
MNMGEELRKARIEKGWKLKDIAAALGTTSATVSRVERGLQEPSPTLLAAWQQLLVGKPWISKTAGRPRHPRGALSELARLFLADVKAGLDEAIAGWREPMEVGLAGIELETLSSEVELDGLGRVRIVSESSLESVKQAKKILEYRKAVEDEERSLTPFIKERLPILCQALRNEKTKGVVLLAGLAKMIRTTAPFVLDACRSILDKDAKCFLSNAVQPARVILECVNIRVPDILGDVLKEVGLEELINACEEGQEAQQARELAHHLSLPALAVRLGKHGVTALGAAWAAMSLLENTGAAIVTEVGDHHLAKAFWEGIGLSRVEVEVAWHCLTEIDEESDGERTGVLLWAWPEVL